MKPRRLLPLLLIAAAFTGLRAPAAATLPAWASEAAATPVAPAFTDADAVVLLRETSIEYATDGRRTNQQRVVVRILKREGRSEARAIAAYLHPADKVRGLEAWLQDAHGSVRRFGRKDTIDVAGDAEMLFSESRTAMIDASKEADRGSLFAWEAITEEPPGRPQALCLLQTRLPVAVARCRLRLPSGWRATGRLHNHAAVEPVAQADALVWTLHDLTEVKDDEPFAPPSEQAWVRLLVDLHPAGPSRATPAGFAAWSEISRFARERFTPSSVASPAIRRRATELCAGKTTTWEKTGAIAAFVQQIRYVAIAANLRRDGGFVPRPAETVLQTGYGDCKDKTSLLCAMLDAVGIPASPVLCFSGDRAAVQPGWPSPLQFNHMITAIRLEEPVDSPLAIEDPAGGHLLLFDPTDEFTALGDFPLANQGGLALVCTDSFQELVPIPVAPADANRIISRLDATLAADGRLTGTYRETRHGSAATVERNHRRELAKARKTVAEDFGAVFRGAIIRDASSCDTPTGNCERTATLEIPRHAQTIRRDLMAVPPSVANQLPLPLFNDKERTRPIRLFASETEAVSEFTLPEGFGLADPGPPAQLTSSYGSYNADTTVHDNRVVVRRRLVVAAVDLPATDYSEVRAFFDAVRKRERTPFLIERR